VVLRGYLTENLDIDKRMKNLITIVVLLLWVYNLISGSSKKLGVFQIAQVVAFFMILAIGLMMPSTILFAQADKINPTVYSVDSKTFGMTYGQWAAKWEQWLLSTPQKDSPATDETGKNCGQNQNGPVWFLAGTPGGSATRSCTIPAGKAILFATINTECSYSERPTLKSESDLVSCARESNNLASNLQTTVDGVNLQQLDKYRVTSPLFNLTFPTGNIFGAPVGTTQAIVDGFYVFLQPLSPGKHEVHFSGLTPANPTTGTTNFSVDVTDHLTVQ
jgi:hypothetical protein